MSEQIKINYLEPIRWHLFNYLHEKKYFFEKEDLYKEIEKFLIKESLAD
jgi:hypothetical protein